VGVEHELAFECRKPSLAILGDNREPSLAQRRRERAMRLRRPVPLPRGLRGMLRGGALRDLMLRP